MDDKKYSASIPGPVEQSVMPFYTDLKKIIGMQIGGFQLNVNRLQDLTPELQDLENYSPFRNKATSLTYISPENKDLLIDKIFKAIYEKFKKYFCALKSCTVFEGLVASFDKFAL